MAIDLGAVPVCSDQFFTSVGATTSTSGNLPTCFNGAVPQRDVWYTFRTTQNISNITIVVTGRPDGPAGQALRNPQIAVYRGSCGGLSELYCASAPPGSDQLRLDADLSANATYFIRINDYSASAAPNWGDFNLCLLERAPAVNLGDQEGSTACYGTLYDSGGPDGNYADREYGIFTICPDDPHSCLEITLNDFRLEAASAFSGPDRLNIYQGRDNQGLLLASVTGVADGTPFVLQAPGGCVTVEFVSDATVNFEGFELEWQCRAAGCGASSFDNPTAIGALPYRVTGLSTCDGKATFGESPCSNDEFLGGPDYIFAYNSPGDECISIQVDGASPATGVAVFRGRPDQGAANCVATGTKGRIASADLREAGEYFIVVAAPQGCSDFNILVDVTECSLLPTLENALRNPLNGCVNPDGLPSIFRFEDGFQDMEITRDVNNGCWLNVGDQADFYWFSIQAFKAGDLGFILTSADEPSDIDFNVWGPFKQEDVVYHPDRVVEYIRTEQPVRSSWSPGRKPTGMIRNHPTKNYPVEDAYDCGSLAGAEGDDFVSPIEAQRGEVYVVLVNDWSDDIRNGGIGVDWSPTTLGLLDVFEPEVIRGDTAICRGEEAQILIDAGTNTIQWISGTETLSCTDCPDPIARPIRTTVYTAVVESVCYSDTIDVKISVFDVDAGPDQTVCIGEEIQIVAGEDLPGANYSWTASAGVSFSCTDCPDPLITAGQAGTTQVIVQLNTANCELRDTMLLTVLPGTAPDYTINNREFAICAGESVEIGIDASSGRNTYIWTSEPPGTTIDQPRFTVSPTVTTKYYVETLGPSCPVASIDSILVEVSTEPLIELGNDTLVCFGDTLQLGFGPKERNTTYTWIGPPVLIDSDSPQAKAVPETSGSYTLTATRGSCTVQESISVTVDPANVTILQSDTLFLCLGQDTLLETSVTLPNLEVSWTAKGDPDVMTATGPTLAISPADTAVYYATVSSGQCTLTDSILVLVDSLPADLSIMPADTMICVGNYAILRTATYETNEFPNIEFFWQPSEGQQTPDSLLNMVVTPDTTTIYYRITTNGACRDSSAARVEVNPIPVLTVTPSDTIVCPGETVRLSLTADREIEDIMWMPEQGLSCTDCDNPTAIALDNITYNVTATAENCPGSTSANIAVFPSPRFFLTDQTLICLGDAVQLNSVFDNRAVYTWTSSTDPDFVSNDPLLIVRPEERTTYTLTVDFPDDDCDAISADVTIDVIGNARVNLSADKTSISPGEEVTITADVEGGTGADRYNWTTSDGRDLNGQIITDRPSGTTTYTLEFILGPGCDTLFADITINVVDYVIPNAFSPNNDNSNDRFRVLISGDIEIVEFKVFNRWGQLVYDNENGPDGWDGTFNGNPQPSDVYAYLIVLRFPDGQEVVEKGDVTLIR